MSESLGPPPEPTPVANLRLADVGADVVLFGRSIASAIAAGCSSTCATVTASRNVELASPAVGVDPAHRAAVRPHAAPARAARWSSIAASLGAPVTEPGGNVASSSSGQPTPGAQPARHRAHQVEQARVRLGDAQAPAPRPTVLAHPAEVVAHQVDDHHVLGPVLREEAVGASRRCP